MQIINKVLKTKNMDIIMKNDLTEAHFIGFEDQFNFIVNHYRKYGNVPDTATFLDEFEDFELLDVTETDNYLLEKCYEEFLYAKLVPILQETASILTNKTSDEALEYLKSQVTTMVPEGQGNAIDIISQALLRGETFKRKRDAETPWMISTGFEALDQHIGGFAREEEFAVVVARTNQGKSWVVSKMAEHMWTIGLNVGYISPEMSADAIGYRFDTLHEHFSNSALYKGVETEGYLEYLEELSQCTKNKFYVATPVDFNRKITVSKLRNFIQEYNLDVLIIDGITYLSDERYKRGDNKTTSLTNISEDLMQLSCEAKVPVIAVVQANRGATGPDNSGTPELETIRDSDGIAHNATKVISIKQTNGHLILSVKKNRNGAVNVDAVYTWDIDRGIFEHDPAFSDYNTHTTANSTRRAEEEPELKQPITRGAVESGRRNTSQFDGTIGI
jgi:replicative DNA helicase